MEESQIAMKLDTANAPKNECNLVLVAALVSNTVTFFLIVDAIILC